MQRFSSELGRSIHCSSSLNLSAKKHFYACDKYITEGFCVIFLYGGITEAAIGDIYYN